MPRFDGKDVTVDLVEIPDQKELKHVEYVLEEKATGKTALVQFYGTVVPDFNDPAVQAKEMAAHFPPDPCVKEINLAVDEALGLVASGVPPAQVSKTVQPTMMQRVRSWVGL